MGGGGGFIGDIVGGVGDIVGGIGDAVGDVVSGVGDVLDGAVEIVSDAGSAVDDFVNEEIPGGWGTVAAVAGGAALASGALGGTAAGAAGTGAGTAGGIATGTSATIFPVAAPGAIISTPIAAGTVGIPAAAGAAAGTAGLLGALEGATATYAPGSLQAQLASQGVNIAGGASTVPGSLGATLAELGVAPLTAGGAATAAANLGTGLNLSSATDALRAANTINNLLGGEQAGVPTGTAGGGFMDILGQVGQGVSGLFSSFAPSGTAIDIGKALIEGISTQDYINKLQDLGSQAQTQFGNLAQQATEGVQFTPYGVSTSLFGTTPTEGGIESTLTGQGQQLSDAALQAALGSYQQAGTADLGQMTQDRMALYQQLVAPEQERARLASEARLAAQGRLGIGAGGGEYAPELRALQDAIAKQNLQFALQAPQEALAQRTALLQQGASAAAIPTALAGQQLQAGQLGGTLGQIQAQTANQRGTLLGDLAGQGISTNLTANIAAALVQGERNKALAQALQGALGTGQTQQQSQQQTTANYLAGLGGGAATGGVGGLLSSPGFGGNLLSDINTVNQGIQAGQAIYNAGSGLFGSLGSIFV